MSGILTPQPPLRSGEGEPEGGSGSLEPVVMNRHVAPEKRLLAREFRRRATEAESLAWKMLRNRGLLGLKFRRQQVVRGFIVDFYCDEKRLALELDGGIHDQQAEADRARDEVLRQASVTVLRLRNEELSHQCLEERIRGILTP